MKRFATIAMVFGLVGLTSCGVLFPGLSLGFDLLVAINAAPEGQKLCAAFDVLDAEPTGRRISALLNVPLAQADPPIQLSEQEGDVLLDVIGAVNCEFITCFVEQVEALEPPTEDTEIAEWVESRITTLEAVINDCPNAVQLTQEQITQIVRLIQALEN
jgi:hypothetical protein